jgi:hypothetical protein
MKLRSIALIIAALSSAASAQELGQLQFPEEPGQLIGNDIIVDLTKLTSDDSLLGEDTDPANGADEGAAQEHSSPAPKEDSDDGVRVVPSLAPADDPASDAGEERGVQVSVSSVSGKLESLDPSEITIKAPFPAKPLAPAPAGWKLARSEDPEAGFEQAVEIVPGTGMKLTIRPHVLVPDSDGIATFAVLEPGFQPSLQYRQVDTVGCMLGESIRHLKADEERIGESIRRLEELLVSLPNPAP